MSFLKRWKLPVLFAASTLAGLGFALWKFEKDERAFLVPGDTTGGHHQIELQCSVCHTPMMGVKSDACLECHEQELDLADDSHPASKFRDPRNADRLKKLDAMDCLTCHVEHQPDATLAMGVTLPMDYCLHCHSDIGDERPTHAGLEFSTCASAGCHNFHDNRALHDNFLERHMDEPPNLEKALVDILPRPEAGGLQAAAANAPAPQRDAHALAEWAGSAHARAEVNCMGCHAEGAADGETAGAWVKQPGLDACQHCHRDQVTGFEAGKHGMRLAQEMSPMHPGDARQTMKAQVGGRSLGCGSCHGSHSYDRTAAAVQACLQCHDDAHSLAYEGSPHHRLFLAETRGEAPPGSGVSCATCHLPRMQHPDTGDLMVMHNQNDNLRPNDKMVRPVCAECHGVPFALDALADRALIDRNFRGAPAVHVKSFDMLREKLGSLGKLGSSIP